MFVGLGVRTQLLYTSSPAALFAAGEPGAWYDPSDLSTMFQDSAGTTPVTAVGQPVGLRLDKSGRGNHASQSTPGSRAIYASVPKGGRRNLLTYTEQFDNAAWTKGGATVSANQVVAPDGTLTADKLVEAAVNQAHYVYQSKTLTATSYTVTVYAKAAERNWLNINCTPSANVGCYFDLANGVLGTIASGYTASITSVGNGWYRCAVAFTGTAVSWFIELETALANSTRSYLGDGTSGIFIWGAQLELGSTATNYQRVGSIYDITEAGVQTLYGLLYDGLDDFYVTSTITPGIDKVQVFAGVRKLSDAASGVIAELGMSYTSMGGFFLITEPSGTRYGFAPRGYRQGLQEDQVNVSGFTAPDTAVLTAKVDLNAGTPAQMRRNAGVFQNSSSTSFGGGNFLVYPLYIGRRGGTTLPYNGYEFGLIVRFGPNLSTAQIASVEDWLNTRTGAY